MVRSVLGAFGRNDLLGYLDEIMGIFELEKEEDIHTQGEDDKEEELEEEEELEIEGREEEIEQKDEL